MKTIRSETLAQRLDRLGIMLTRGLRDQRTCWMLEKEDPHLGRSWQISASNLDDVEALAQKLEQRQAQGDHMGTYTFGVPRPWEPGTTAVITVTTTKPLSANGVKKVLMAAATAWAHTPSGAGATREHRANGWDFNIGDLSLCLGDPALELALHNQGIADLQINTVIGDERSRWEFDDSLLDLSENAANHNDANANEDAS